MMQNSEEEHKFVKKLRNMWFSKHKERPLWIGCTIFNQALSCLGETDIFTKWGGEGIPNEPQKKCVYKGPNDRGNLFSADCNELKFAMCETPSVPVYCVSLGGDGRVTSQCLQGHEIKNLTVKGVSECGQACWAEPRCRSFNLWQGGRDQICQLNDAAYLEASIRSFINHGKCLYFNP